MKLRFQLGALIFAALLAWQSAVASAACPAMPAGVEGTSTTCGFKGCEGHGQLPTPNPTRSSRETCCQIGWKTAVGPARISREEKQRDTFQFDLAPPNRSTSSARAGAAVTSILAIPRAAKSFQTLYCQSRT